MPERSITAVINPLAFLAVDEPWANLLQEAVGAEQVIGFLCNPGESRDIDALISRYKRISVENPRLFAAPSDQRILERLIWPLRQAKGAFMLGHHLATISLCGMVAEMSAILAFDIGGVMLNGQAMDEGKQRSVFGNTFEKLGQERRVEVLGAYGLIDEGTRNGYHTIRISRRRYLHLWSADHATLESDAIACFTAAVGVVVSTLGLSVKEGKLILKDGVLEYVAKHLESPRD